MQQNCHVFTSHLVMVRPFNFHCNQQTVSDNIYQQENNTSHQSVHEKAIQEFDQFVEILRLHKIKVTVVQDNGKHDTPDSIFPNNWISFHHKKKAIRYPMYAPNRRKERQLALIQQLQQQLSTKIQIIHDYSPLEQENVFLEGTGSMVLDRQHKIVYAVISQRTHKQLLQQFCYDLNYELCSFHASQYSPQKKQKVPIYHTNVLMSVSNNFVMIGLQLIDSEEQKQKVRQCILNNSKKEIIDLNEQQIKSFAGNTLTILTQTGQYVLIMSKTAYQSLSQQQILRIQKSTKIIQSDLSVIQTNGGGSARCMLAEVF